jgi:hypothetical protein
VSGQAGQVDKGSKIMSFQEEFAGPAMRETADGPKKRWSRPRVIESEIDKTEATPGAGPDGFPTPPNSTVFLPS